MPGTQVALLQQPPWHSVRSGSLHRVSQVCVVVRQAWPTGQSSATSQPHSPSRQAWPPALWAQSAHAVPSAPHAAGAAPGTHVPSSQQPPWHAE